MAGSVPVLNLPEKCIIPASKNISVIISYLLWNLGGIGFIFHKLFILIFLVLILQNQEDQQKI